MRFGRRRAREPSAQAERPAQGAAPQSAAPQSAPAPLPATSAPEVAEAAEPMTERQPADPSREELVEFADETDDTEPMLMPGPVPAPPVLEVGPPAPQSPAAAPTRQEPVEPPGAPAAEEPAPPLRGEPAPAAGPVDRSDAKAPPPRERLVGHPPLPLAPPATPSSQQRRLRLPRVSPTVWRRVGDIVLILVAVAVIAAAVFAVQR